MEKKEVGKEDAEVEEVRKGGMASGGRRKRGRKVKEGKS